MAIENILERIATALEVLVEQHCSPEVKGVRTPAPITHPDAPIALYSTETTASSVGGTKPQLTQSNVPISAQGTMEAVELDAQGLPWDKRIHSSSKALMASGARNGCWKYLKGVDKALIPAVEQELREAAPAQVEATEPPVTVATTPPAVASNPAPVGGMVDIEAVEEGNLAVLQQQVGLVAQQLGPRAVEIPTLLAGPTYNVSRLSDLPSNLYRSFLWDVRALITGA